MPLSLSLRSAVSLQHSECSERHLLIQVLMVSKVALDEVPPVIRERLLLPSSLVIAAGLSATLLGPMGDTFRPKCAQSQRWRTTYLSF